MAIETTGLREAKKRETRQLISEHATRLFIAQGYEQTTIVEIADAARVAKKTVTNYFARKEDLALGDQEEFVGSLAETVATRSPGESVPAALRRTFADAVATRSPVAGFCGPELARVIADSPTLTTCLRGLHDQREQRLAQTLAEAARVRPDDVAVETAAGMLGAVHRVLFERVRALTLAGQADDRIADTIGAEAARAFELLETGLAGWPYTRVQTPG
ncbi:TetR/AcrR family transcriptional regulator [Amycolatopsis sp. NPDC004772]